MKRRATCWLAFVWGLWLLACKSAPPHGSPATEEHQLVVFAATSLKEPVEELARRYEERTGDRVVTHFAGSNLLAQQIASSRRQDVYFSANREWVDYLAEGGVLRRNDIRPLCGNRLVVAARRDARIQLSDLRQLLSPEVKHVAIGDPRGVPAGRYARRALESVGLWTSLASRVVPNADVRAALLLASADPHTVGLVYRTDVGTVSGMAALLEVPIEATGPIEYFVSAVSRGAEPTPQALAFLALATSAEAKALLARHGFVVDDS